MKKYFFSLVVLFAALCGFNSCDDTSELENQIATLQQQLQELEGVASKEKINALNEELSSANSNLAKVQKEISILKATNGHAYVDLGLPSGNLWATCNLGANSQEESGTYYSWGVLMSGNYDEANYAYANGGDKLLNEEIDLTPEDDAAAVYLGGNWRIPCKADFEELLTECKWEWNPGTTGYHIIRKNGNRIYLEVTGYYDGTNKNYPNNNGCYWSREGYHDMDDANMATAFFFSSTDKSLREGGEGYKRWYGMAIRPVCYPKGK